MKHKQIISVLLAVVMLLSVAPVSFAANNSTQENATPVTLGEEISFTAEAGKSYWYSVETTKSGQFIKVESNYNRVYFYDADGNSLDYSSDGDSTEGYVYCTSTNNAGKYSIKVYPSGSAPRDYVITVTLVDNDVYEPNNTEETAYLLTAGVPVEFQLGYSDIDYFIIETTKDGQDVKIDFSGFNYANTGYFDFQPDGGAYIRIEGNKTLYVHVPKAGRFAFYLDSYYSNSDDWATTGSFRVTATVLDGDANEPNDTLEQATHLPIGTDATFSMGGKGDEDWFTFESAFDGGESVKMFTLQLMDLATDYSDEFYYDLYAPDGTKLMSAMEIDIRHTNVIACEQEGLYALRLYRTSYTSPRSELRICVQEGGADPYEPNDTWLTAAQAQDGQPIQFILSTTEDEDWFRIDVPEANMTLKLQSDSTVYYDLYSAVQLEEFGTNSSLDYEDISGSYYYQLGEPGVYYMCFTSQQSYISTDVRTITPTLEAAKDVERNNTWKTATPIYEGVPTNYDLTASNDYDWFVFEIPEGVKRLRISGDWSDYRRLYRGQDFETAGDDAAPIAVGSSGVINPKAGMYYLQCTNGREMDQTVVYYLYTEDLPAQSMEEAEPLPEGQWLEDVYGGYYALGNLKAGDELRLYGDNIRYVDLYNEAGEQQWSDSMGSVQNSCKSIPADGVYYLKVTPYATYEDGSYKAYRLLYDVADRELVAGEQFTLEGPDTITVAVGETAEVDLRVAPFDVKIEGNGNFIDYNSPANTSVASASCNYARGFYITGNAVGSTTVKYYLEYYLDGYYDSVYKTITINVVDPTAAQTVTINNAPAQLPLGTSAQLSAVLTPADSTDSITWSSSDSAVLYVSDKGVVTAVGDGSATITATASSGVAATAEITVVDAPVKPEVTGIGLSAYNMTLYVGEPAITLTANVQPATSAAAVTWISSNLDAATVNQSGVVTPVGPGVSVITAQAGDYRASCIVTVQAPRVRVDSISFDQTVLEIPLGGESTLRPVFNPVNATVQGLTWVSSDPVVASVSRTGIVRTLTAGETTITATTLDGGKQASILIRVTAAPQPGDINGDGYVDAADAMITLQVAVGKVELNDAEFEAADVNGDGWVDAADAVRILRYDAGLIDSLEN